MAKERPILISSDMVRAILDNRKSQTRRVVKGIPTYYCLGNKPQTYDANELAFLDMADPIGTYPTYVKCPYGVVGDLLWVREGWRCTGGGDLRNIIYRAEGDSARSFCGVDDGRAEILHVPEPHWAEWDRLVYKTNKGCNWRSPIHMYKWAARIWLEITGIRVERVQDISEEDCLEEGITRYVGNSGVGGHMHHDWFYVAFPEKGGGLATAKEAFELSWDSHNDKRYETIFDGEGNETKRLLNYGWDMNPWVWVIEFKKIERK